MRCADANQVPAGGALAVDRDGFSAAVSAALAAHPRIEIQREEIAGLPPADWPNVVVATGPLTSLHWQTRSASYPAKIPRLL
jgi:methylenetetrahydrofolate--tRNA-(uracil-5-)-methyltransferase